MYSFYVICKKYLQGSWKEKFNKDATKDEDFYVSKDSKIKVPMMQKLADYKYGESKELDAKVNSKKFYCSCRWKWYNSVLKKYIFSSWNYPTKAMKPHSSWSCPMKLTVFQHYKKNWRTLKFYLKQSVKCSR